jgi:myosin-5
MLRYCLARAVPMEENEEKKKDPNQGIATSSTLFASFYERLGCEPHIYEVSASAYRGLTLEDKNQMILVSGESGAGKTETVKLVLHHLANIEWAAVATGDGLNNEPSQAMVNRIIESSPVFEAFGNAKTQANHNSSRFGKVTRMHFAVGEVGMRTLTGSSFVTYLLETSRVVAIGPGERSFHIFHQLLAASEAFKVEHLGDEWNQTSTTDFRYLAGSSEAGIPDVCDADGWMETLHALESFQFQGAALSMLVQALGIVLQLGNIAFVDDSEGEARISSETELAKLSKALGIDSSAIDEAMVRRSIRTNTEYLKVPLNADAAMYACDALSKKIYERLFASIVRTVNEQTRSPVKNEHSLISLVDIFGFERFDTNRFEQLCINYANEKLQQKYVQDNLRRIEIEYENEGLALFDFEMFDNNDVLELLEGPMGVINLLTEESIIPNGNTEVS